MRQAIKILFLSLLIIGVISGCGGGEHKKEGGGHAKKEGGGHGGGEKGSEGGEIIYTFKESFVVNLIKENPNDGMPNNYLKVKIGLLLSAETANAEIGAGEYKVMDRINYILSRQTLKSIATDSGKDNIKKEIKEAVNKLLTEGEIKDVFFAEFVSQ